jgi:phytoene synthase
MPDPASFALSRSYRWCERLARREAGNFYHAFRLLPGSRRRAMCALYSFFRIADDLADGPGSPADKGRMLDRWQQSLEQALQGRFSHPLHPALQHAVASYQVPPEYLLAVLDGVRMDLAPAVYATFDDLYRYCWHVASAVGLACIHVWGYSDEQAKTHAESAGIAFQLTNILRDLGEDAARRRIYLPAEDLERFGYRPEQLLHGERNAAFRELMGFELARARRYYDAALPLVQLLQPDARAVFLVMLRTYRSLLDVIESRDYDVFGERIRVAGWWKLAILLRAVPVRWGLI